jgi:hypothetical protein
VIKIAFMWSSCSWGTFSGRMAILTSRFVGSSTLSQGLSSMMKSQIQSLSSLMFGQYLTASAGCCRSTTSSLWVSVPGKYLVPFGRSRTTWD